MHRHLIWLVARPAPPRQAKVIQLEARRQARHVQEQLKRVPPRPAA
jgi:hypothetical protein